MKFFGNAEKKKKSILTKKPKQNKNPDPKHSFP